MPPPPPLLPAGLAAHSGPGAPPRLYLKAHGTRVAKQHLLDWAVLVFLAALDGALNVIEPFHRFVGEDAVPDLRYPLKGNTVPVWAVPVLAVAAPAAVVAGMYVRRRNAYDLHHAILGKFFNLLCHCSAPLSCSCVCRYLVASEF